MGSMSEQIFLPPAFPDAKPCPTQDARARAPPPASEIPDPGAAARSARQTPGATQGASSATPECRHTKPYDRASVRYFSPRNAPPAKAKYPETDAAWRPETPHWAALRC